MVPKLLAFVLPAGVPESMESLHARLFPGLSIKIQRSNGEGRALRPRGRKSSENAKMVTQPPNGRLWDTLSPHPSLRGSMSVHWGSLSPTLGENTALVVGLCLLPECGQSTPAVIDVPRLGWSQSLYFLPKSFSESTGLPGPRRGCLSVVPLPYVRRRDSK